MPAMIRPMTRITTTTTTTDAQWIDLGRIAYQPALEMQRRVHAEVLAGDRPPTVLLLEHDPVITISRRDGAAAHLLVGEERLALEGVEVCRTDRGGDITYHGPGQLVVYPILPLDRLGLNLRRYVRLLERVVIETAAAFGVEAHRDECAVGVWVGGEKSRNTQCESPSEKALPHPSSPISHLPSPISHPSRKVAAIGVRVRRWVSMHGLALNVTTNLDHFQLIVPCGLPRPVTSLHRELGDRCPILPEVKDTLIQTFQHHLADSEAPGRAGASA